MNDYVLAVHRKLVFVLTCYRFGDIKYFPKNNKFILNT